MKREDIAKFKHLYFPIFDTKLMNNARNYILKKADEEENKIKLKQMKGRKK